MRGKVGWILKYILLLRSPTDKDLRSLVGNFAVLDKNPQEAVPAGRLSTAIDNWRKQNIQ